MDCTSTQLSYGETGYFSNIVTDYISGDNNLTPFYQNPVSLEGIHATITSRQNFKTNRTLLVNELHLQYKSLPASDKVNRNIDLLTDEKTFTVCTAHQPAI